MKGTIVKELPKGYVKLGEITTSKPNMLWETMFFNCIVDKESFVRASIRTGDGMAIGPPMSRNGNDVKATPNHMRDLKMIFQQCRKSNSTGETRTSDYYIPATTEYVTNGFDTGKNFRDGISLLDDFTGDGTATDTVIVYGLEPIVDELITAHDIYNAPREKVKTLSSNISAAYTTVRADGGTVMSQKASTMIDEYWFALRSYYHNDGGYSGVAHLYMIPRSEFNSDDELYDEIYIVHQKNGVGVVVEDVIVGGKVVNFYHNGKLIPNNTSYSFNFQNTSGSQYVSRTLYRVNKNINARVNVNGQVREVAKVFANVNGQKREVVKMFANINGKVREI